MSNAIEPDLDLPVVGLAPPPEERASFHSVSVTPAAGPAYKYSLVLPAGWYKQPDLPDVSPVPDADYYAALGVFSPGEQLLPPITLSVGVTVTLTDDPVIKHLTRYCEREGFEVLLMRPQQYAAGSVVECLAVQPHPAIGPATMRIAMFDDGGRLFVVAGMAPSSMYRRFVNVLSLGMLTFELESPEGPAIPLLEAS